MESASMTLGFLLLLVLGLLYNNVQCLDTALTNEEQARFTDILREKESFKDIMSSFYAVFGLKALGKDVPDVENICNLAKNVNKDDVNLVYHALAITNVLGCKNQLKDVKFNSFVKADSDVHTISFVIAGLSRLGEKVDDKLIKALETALKTDDSPSSAARAFLATSLLPNTTNIKFATDMVEDIVAQADDVDSRMLMFEGGLEVTSRVVNGIFALCEQQRKSMSVSEEQVRKFSQYFLSRKYVIDVKDIFHVASALSVLSRNKFHVPVIVSVFKSNQITDKNPVLKIRVTDVLDNSIEGVKVNAVSVVSSDDIAVIENRPFTKGPEDDYIIVESTAARGYLAANTHLLDIMSSKPSRGMYTVTVNVDFKKDAKIYVGGVDAKLKIKVLSKITIEDVVIGVADRDQVASRNPLKAKYPDKIGRELDADYHQKIVMKFSLKEVSSGEITTAHQTFIRLTHVKTGQEIFFVAQPEGNGIYKFNLDLGTTGKDSFNNLSGKYKMDLIVGDATIQIPIKWQIAIVSLSFADEPKKSKKQERLSGPRPAIEHMFRQPDKRPPRIISNTFTALLGVPFVIMFLLWAKIGANVSNFEFSVTTAMFHIGLACIFVLYYMFWLRLDMFKTLQYLVVVGGVTFLGGNKMLAKMASTKQNRT